MGILTRLASSCHRLSMEQCPKCGSFNTRRSRRQGDERLLRRLVAARFRCRDCGATFSSIDHFMIQQWIVGTVALMAIVGAATWAIRERAGVESPKDSPQLATAENISDFASEKLNAQLTEVDASLQQAAEAGDPQAQYQLGLSIVQQSWQRGDQLEMGNASKWFRKAAEQDHLRAGLVLGTLYEKGRGVVQDYREAIAWYRSAAQRGDPVAMARLGHMYKAGRGVDKSLIEAYVWLNLAAARGDTYAEVDRNRLRTMLSASELREAQLRSRNVDAELPRLSDVSRPLPANF